MRKSAGILLYRTINAELEVFLVHPGGPFWQHKDHGAWSVPKGEFTDEEPFVAALREFREETGYELSGKPKPLAPIKQKGGKIIYAFAMEGNVDAATIVSNTFRQEFPYKSGRWHSFPEVDKAGWFAIGAAREKINLAQAALLDDLLAHLRGKGDPA